MSLSSTASSTQNHVGSPQSCKGSLQQQPQSCRSFDNWITRTKTFQQLTSWAFHVCDANGSGKIGKTELYAGILLVHLQLAKYMGAAACYPPSKEIIDQLFIASDADGSGAIDEEEFTKIMVICCAQITSRIIVYFAILVFLAKYAAKMILEVVLSFDDILGCKKTPGRCVLIEWFEKAMTLGEFAETSISLLLFFLVVPMIFNYIDRSSKRAAENTEAKVVKAS